MLLTKTISYILIFFLLFPYLSLIELRTDTQPYGLLFAIILTLSLKPKLNQATLLYFIVFLWSILVFFIDTSDPFNAVRSIANYASLFFISYSLYRIIPKVITIESLEKILKISFYVWLLAGVLQTLIDRNIFDFIISVRTTDNRGVTGLAPEPTFYGMTLLFYGLILYLIDKKNIIHVVMCAIGIIFLAQSSMAAAYLLLVSTFFLVFSKKIKMLYKAVAIIILFGLITVILNIDQNTRLGYLAISLIEDPMSILEKDASIGDRFSHIILSFKGFFENYTIPNGYNASQLYFTSNASNLNMLNVDWLSTEGRIMSGYGAAFFELGFIALLIPFSMIYTLKKKNKDIMPHFISINIIMLSAIQLANPFFIIYLTLILITQKTEKSNEYSINS
jgi:hypothetical protein